MNYGITISGTGTAQEIADSLRDIAHTIEGGTPEGTYEDPTLCTEICSFVEPTEIEQKHFGLLIKEDV